MLPPHLAERLEPNAPAPRKGSYVIYWMRLAARVEENAALDVALSLAATLRLPCFVYHAVSERYRYASDRLHAFMLEGARDVQRALADRHLGAAFHLEREGHRGPMLAQLAHRAALVVTDASPLEPFTLWDASLAKLVPLWRVDTSCVVPSWLIDKRFDSAAEFRRHHDQLRASRLSAPWPAVETTSPAFLPELPFTPVDLQRASLPELIAQCDIDHGVAPVSTTPGGSTAGLARWAEFLDKRLPDYRRRRADPLANGTSRMSAYLHFGHVAATKLARDAAAHPSDGALKFLDELITWRELGWNFCRHTPSPQSVEALPEWSRETLHRHERDRREFLPSFEELARAQTGNTLWDSSQRSLLTHGELHNSLRMTWAKALLEWTNTAADALALAFDLNHRYALDGRDPASVAGILWCFGAFDHPFHPERPRSGSVRPRPLEEQARKVNVAELTRRTRLPASGRPLTVGVVGAGVAGAAASRVIADAGHAVTLFEREALPGGRVATVHDGSWQFDTGVTSLQVSDERFARWARSWWHERTLVEWKPRGVLLEPRHVVATPSMSALVQRMLYGLDVRTGVEVNGVVREGTRWRLRSPEHQSVGEFDVVLCCAPAGVSASLLDPPSFALASTIRAAQLAPQWVVLVGFERPTTIEADLLTSDVSPIATAARDSSKPERHGSESWVLRASLPWSARHVETDDEVVASELLDAFVAMTGAPRTPPTFISALLWREAVVTAPLGSPCVFDATLQLGAAGDWCLGPTVEHAWLSGVALGGQVNALVAPARPVEPALPRRQLTLL